jgi:predicted GTPase
MFDKRNIPCVVAANKQDLRKDKVLERSADQAGAAFIVTTNALTGEGIDRLREMLTTATPQEFIESAPIIADLVKPNDIVLLVTPIDIEAPKGRLKMLQVHCMREILDKGASAIVTKETELPNILSGLTYPPALVVCDSQVFEKVAGIIDEIEWHGLPAREDTAKMAVPQIPLTTFSILMARFKGDIAEMLKGIEKIGALVPGDHVLIAEACTHHPIGEDIGRVQIPKLLEKAAGGKLQIDISAGHDFPDDLGKYKLIIHCGACVLNRKEMLSRIEKAISVNVPITNYGLVITACKNMLCRAIAPVVKERRPIPAAG